MQFQSPLLQSIPGISHAFGTKLQPIPEAYLAYAETPSCSWRQIHSAKIVELADSNHTPGEADGFWTAQSGLPVKVHTADCVPVLLARKDAQKVAAIHAGWRGLLAHILENFWSSTNESPAQWVASIGPSVGDCCYELEVSITDQFAHEFSSINPVTYTSESQNGAGFRMFDPGKLAAEILKSMRGLEFDHVKECTYCRKEDAQPVFYSHRRRTHQNIDEGRRCQHSIIMRTN